MKLVNLIKTELYDYKILLRAIPSAVVVLFCTSVVMMNLLANKEVVTGFDWLRLDCGFFLSWMSFLGMDMITKRFGPKAAIKITLFAIAINLLVCLINFLIVQIPGNWAMYYDLGDPANFALNATFGGTWYVLLGSTCALICSSIVNSTLNATIGNLFSRTSKTEFMVRSYVSTLVGQFVDNLVFAIMVSYVFFGWTPVQVVVCALTGAIAELLCEVLFSPIGYKITKTWEFENVGSEYIEHTQKSGELCSETN